MNEHRWLLAAAALSLASGCAHPPSGRGVLPPELESQYYHQRFRGFGGPPLWTRDALRGHRKRIRLTAVGSARLRASIRIDEHSDGRVTGHVAIMDGSRERSRYARTEREFSVPLVDLERLLVQAAEAGLWRSHQQFWQSTDPDSICIDGIELVFERADEQGYRFAVANAQCTAPPALLAVAARLFEIAGERRLQRLLE